MHGKLRFVARTLLGWSFLTVLVALLTLFGYGIIRFLVPTLLTKDQLLLNCFGFGCISVIITVLLALIGYKVGDILLYCDPAGKAKEMWNKHYRQVPQKHNSQG